MRVEVDSVADGFDFVVKSERKVERAFFEVLVFGKEAFDFGEEVFLAE